MSIAAIEKNGITLNVHPEGRLDTLRAPLLDQELQPHLAGVSQVVMDFSNVLYISSSALRLLLCLEKTMEERGGEVQVIHAKEAVLNTLELAGFTDVLHVIPD